MKITIYNECIPSIEHEEIKGEVLHYERAIVKKLRALFPCAEITFTDGFLEPGVEVQDSANDEDCVLIIVDAIEEVLAEGSFWH